MRDPYSVYLRTPNRFVENTITLHYWLLLAFNDDRLPSVVSDRSLAYPKEGSGEVSAHIKNALR